MLYVPCLSQDMSTNSLIPHPQMWYFSKYPVPNKTSDLHPLGSEPTNCHADQKDNKPGKKYS